MRELSLKHTTSAVVAATAATIDKTIFIECIMVLLMMDVELKVQWKGKRYEGDISREGVTRVLCPTNLAWTGNRYSVRRVSMTVSLVGLLFVGIAR